MKHITQVTIMPEGEAIYAETATTITIVDEAAGEFVEVAQHNPNLEGAGKIAITPEEWPELRDAIEEMIGRCRL
jgi:hypothetical protein